jgi:hypothetical protein
VKLTGRLRRIETEFSTGNGPGHTAYGLRATADDAEAFQSRARQYSGLRKQFARRVGQVVDRNVNRFPVPVRDTPCNRGCRFN